MNIIVLLDHIEDVTEACLLSDTRINYDISRRVSTAAITVLGRSPETEARYDQAYYDRDFYAVDVHILRTVTILNRDAAAPYPKLFEGQIFSMDLAPTDAHGPQTYYRCSLNDYATWLDRSVAWGDLGITFPTSDKALIEKLVEQYVPEILGLNIDLLVPVLMSFDYQGKNIRQCLDDICAISMGEWMVDYDAVLHYRAAADAPPSAFGLSTSPNGTTTFPFRLDSYRADFTNPVNKAYVRGAWDVPAGVLVEASYTDPVSVARYGEYQYAITDNSITNAFDAELRAKATVLTYAYPIQTGSFTLWKDGLYIGHQVDLHEDNVGLDGSYIIRALSLAWESKELVRYTAQFGANRPDLETYLRLVTQRAKFQTSLPQGGLPLPGSVSDSSIAPGGITAGSIGSVNASSIIGLIQAGQIGTVNATTITGSIEAHQIGSVNASVIVGQIDGGQIGSIEAGSITGLIQAHQIGSVTAGVIQGVIVSDQLANQIINSIAKYADALRPVPLVGALPALPSADYIANTYVYNSGDGHFYRVSAAGTTWIQDDSVSGSMRFYYLGAINANEIIGLILAGQIQSITAGQIVGLIQAAQIGSVTASTIQGSIQASQIGSVNATSIQGTITAAQIGSVNATAITGTITASQIGSVNASTITGTIQGSQINNINATTITIGLLQDNQIGNVSGAKLTVGTVASDKLNAFEIQVGGGGNKPGRFNVLDAGQSTIGLIGNLDGSNYGGWFHVFGAGGTGYSTAQVRTDAAGNLYVNDAHFTVTSGTFTVYTSPTTFDQTYSSLAMVVSGSGDLCSHVSRGVLIYNSGRLLGGLVRDPNIPSNMQLVFYNASSVLDILIDGNTGIVRAVGFQAGGNPGYTGQIPAGKAINVSGGIITSYVP